MEKPTKNTSIHVVMFPWVAYGHFIPFLHLSNKFAKKGNRVSFLLPKSAHSRLQEMNKHPDLIHFLPLSIPHVDGLPLNAETASDVPFDLHMTLASALDKTKDQFKNYLTALKPDLVFYDFAFWISGLSREDEGYGGFKAIYHPMVSITCPAFYLVPSRVMDRETTTVEDLMQPPPGYPSSCIQLKREEAAKAFIYFKSSGGLTFRERLVRGMQQSDAISVATCSELEGKFADYIAEQLDKHVLLMGPILPETEVSVLEEKWANWLNKFDAGSVVYCAFGSQTILEKDQFQELLLGFELIGLPFLVALTPPHGCPTVEEALPDGFKQRVQDRGWVYGGWVPQPLILKHASVGCFVHHCGYGSRWESLLSESQIVLVPQLIDQIIATKLLVNEFKVAVEVERGENGWITKESLAAAIKSVTDKDSAFAAEVNRNHAQMRDIISASRKEDKYFDAFVQSLHDLLQSKN